MISSLSDSTLKQYGTALKFWWNFCLIHNQDPVTAGEKFVLKCLTQKFAEGAAYGTLNSMRSAITLVNVNNLTESKDLNRFMKGVFRIRPVLRKYDSTWDTTQVLEILETWYPLDSLDFSKLTHKLVMLLALGSGYRVQSLSLIKLNNITRKNNGIEIKISDLIKTSRPGVANPITFFPFFEDKPQLCIARTLLFYLEITKNIRNNTQQLFISTIQPYKPVSSKTISRWIKEVLTEAGVDNKFTAHSTRHASTSKAQKKGLNINLIKKAAGWSESSKTFDVFYNTNIEVEDNFAKKVFDM